jgi:hypothetical protein
MIGIIEIKNGKVIVGRINKVKLVSVNGRLELDEYQWYLLKVFTEILTGYTLSDKEVSEKTAIKIGSKLILAINHDKVKEVVERANQNTVIQSDTGIKAVKDVVDIRLIKEFASFCFNSTGFKVVGG